MSQMIADERTGRPKQFVQTFNIYAHLRNLRIDRLFASPISGPPA
jgi:hypothetical protein